MSTIDVFFSRNEADRILRYLCAIEFALISIQQRFHELGNTCFPPNEVNTQIKVDLIIARHLAVAANLQVFLALPCFPKRGRNFLDLASNEREIDGYTKSFQDLHGQTHQRKEQEMFVLWSMKKHYADFHPVVQRALAFFQNYVRGRAGNIITLHIVIEAYDPSPDVMEEQETPKWSGFSPFLGSELPSRSQAKTMYECADARLGNQV